MFIFLMTVLFDYRLLFFKYMMYNIWPKNKPLGAISLGLGFESSRLRTSLPALPNSRGGGGGGRGGQ
jgi:hypothetical protein